MIKLQYTDKQTRDRQTNQTDRQMLQNRITLFAQLRKDPSGLSSTLNNCFIYISAGLVDSIIYGILYIILSLDWDQHNVRINRISFGEFTRGELLVFYLLPLLHVLHLFSGVSELLLQLLAPLLPHLSGPKWALSLMFAAPFCCF